MKSLTSLEGKLFLSKKLIHFRRSLILPRNGQIHFKERHFFVLRNTGITIVFLRQIKKIIESSRPDAPMQVAIPEFRVRGC